MKRMLALLLLPSCTAVSAPLASAPEVDRGTPNVIAQAVPPIAEAELTVTITTQPTVGSVEVRVSSRSEVPHEWLLEDSTRSEVSDLVLRGARGAVKVKTSQLGSSLSISADGPLEPPVELAYSVRPKPSNAPDRTPCRFAVDADFAHFCGEQVLALPVQPQAIPLRLELAPDASFHKQAASSLGLDDILVGTRRVEDLRHAAYVFGNLTSAEFRGAEGNDHAASLGYLSFDPRWIAAESASFRSSLDRFFDLRRSPEDPSVGLIVLSGTHPSEPFAIVRRTRGALISADVSAPWTPQARIRLTQLWAQRTVGGALWIGSRDPAEELRGLWFSEGMSRAAALFVLNEQGFLSANDLAHDVNGLLASDALSPLHGASQEELATKAGSPDAETREEARRLLAVRGALLGLSLGSDAFRKTAHKLLETAKDQQTDVLAEDVFFATLATATSAQIAATFQRGLRSGAFFPEKTLLAPCHQLTKRTLAEFELGFELAKDAAGTQTVRTVKANSNAERAGLRIGDVVSTLDYRPGVPEVAVEGRSTRGAQTVKLRFFPQGRSALGYVFSNAPRAPRSCE